MKYQLEKIFPGSRLIDIHEYLSEKGLSINGDDNTQYLYHDPCHSPIKNGDPISIVSKLLNKNVLLSDRCCGEAGTFALSRPDIATQVRFRKEEELQKGIEKICTSLKTEPKNIKLVTSCPACQQGLSRYKNTTGLDTDYIVVEMANKLLGKNWQKEFITKATRGGVERVLL